MAETREIYISNLTWGNDRLVLIHNVNITARWGNLKFKRVKKKSHFSEGEMVAHCSRPPSRSSDWAQVSTSYWVMEPDRLIHIPAFRSHKVSQHKSIFKLAQPRSSFLTCSPNEARISARHKLIPAHHKLINILFLMLIFLMCLGVILTKYVCSICTTLLLAPNCY